MHPTSNAPDPELPRFDDDDEVQQKAALTVMLHGGSGEADDPSPSSPQRDPAPHAQPGPRLMWIIAAAMLGSLALMAVDEEAGSIAALIVLAAYMLGLHGWFFTRVARDGIGQFLAVLFVPFYVVLYWLRRPEVGKRYLLHAGAIFLYMGLINVTVISLTAMAGPGRLLADAGVPVIDPATIQRLTRDLNLIQARLDGDAGEGAAAAGANPGSPGADRTPLPPASLRRAPSPQSPTSGAPGQPLADGADDAAAIPAIERNFLTDGAGTVAALTSRGDDALPDLLTLSQAHAPRAREAAAEMLGRLDSVAAAGALSALAFDPHPQVRQAARDALLAHPLSGVDAIDLDLTLLAHPAHWLGDPPLLGVEPDPTRRAVFLASARSALNDPAFTSPDRFVELAARWAGDQSPSLILDVMHARPDPRFGRAYGQALGQVGSGDIAQVILNETQRYGDPLRLRMLEGLGQRLDEPAVVDWLTSRDPVRRQLAWDLLPQFGGVRALLAINQLARATSPRGAEAARARNRLILERYGDLPDASPELASVLLAMLTQMKPAPELERVAYRVSPWLLADHAPTARYAAALLRQHGSAADVARAVHALERRLPEAPRIAGPALTALGTPAVPVALRHLASSDRDVVVACVDILAEHGDRGAASSLQTLVTRSGEDPELNAAALRALRMAQRRREPARF